MNKKLLYALPLCALLSSCESFAPGTVPGTVPGCHVPHRPTVCTGARNELTINVNGPNLTAAPPMVCAEKGTTINVKIQPPNADVAVLTAPKSLTDAWIYAGNVPDQNKMEIKVPANANVKKYSYLIVASNGKCLDPMIHVDK